MFLRCVSVAQYLPLLCDSDSQDEWFFILLYAWARELMLVSFYQISTPLGQTRQKWNLYVYGLFGDGETVFFRDLQFVHFLRVLQSFYSLSFYS